MKLIFDNLEKRLTIKECNFDAIEIQKNGFTVADIPLTNGEGFITNTDDILLDDNLDLYVYNKLKVKKLKKADNLIEAKILVDEKDSSISTL